MLRSPRSSAPVSSWWATSSIRPSSRDAPSITASSSADAAVASSSRGSTPSSRTTGVRQRVEHAQHRPEHRDVGPVRQRQREQRALGVGDGHVLRHHLADHHVEERDDRERHHEADRVQQAARAGRRTCSMASSMSPATAGSATKPRSSDAIVMPSWAPASCRLRWRIDPTRDPGPGAPLLRQRLELRAPAGDERELDRHEEAVGEQQEQRQRGGSVAITTCLRRDGAGSPEPHRGDPVPVELHDLDPPAVVIEALAHLRDAAERARARSRRGSRSRPRARRSRRRRTPRRGAGCRRAATRPARCTRVSRGVGRSCSSSISPTISSRMSSRVMIPAVPPCSSTTTARWLPDATQVGEQVGEVAGLGHDEGRRP